MTTPHDPALSFGAGADAYDRARPSYPAEVVDWLLEGVDGPVVDVGAGTGKLTASLAARRDAVVAVEPDDGMRAVLAAQLAGVDARAGTAEAMPLESAAAGLIVRPQRERDHVLSAVREVGEERAGDDGSVRLPYETHAFRFDLV